MDLPPGPSNEIREMDLEKELTNKFLSGQMSFADYSNEWYKGDDEEEADLTKKPDDESRQSIQISDKTGTRRRKYTRLSAALLGLMGEANLRFVRGETETAEKMCHEIIKQMPTAPEPYQTLSQIYENDPEKSLQFSLLAAHLSPSDATEWLRLASISKQRDDLRQEVICYGHAIKAEPHNLATHLKRIEALSGVEEKKYQLMNLSITVVKCYHKIVTSLPASEGEAIIKYMKMATTIYHKSNETERALQVMAAAYKKCSNLFTLEDINIFLELLISQRQYQTCIEVFVANAGVDIEAEIQTVRNSSGEIEEHTNYINCFLPDNLAIDLKSKLLICFIHLGASNLVQTLLSDFLINDVEKAGDLYMDIEEALSSVGLHDLALKLLEPLVNNTSFDLGAVWLKHAECLYKLGREDEAIESYEKVLKHAPQHADARGKLFAILEKKGWIDKALEVLQQDYKYVVNAKLLYEQCSVLKKYGKDLKYLEVGEALLSKNFMRYKNFEELSLARTMKGGTDVISNFRTLRGESIYSEYDLHFDEDETFKFSLQQEWAFFTELLDLALHHRQYFTMQRLAFGAYMSKALISAWRAEVDFFCLQACLLNKDYKNSFRFVRDLTLKKPTTRSWNLLNLVLNMVDENSHIKFLTRLFLKETNQLKNLFLGKNFLSSGRYIVALKYFLDYFEQNRDALSALSIAIAILVMAAQRTVDKHQNLILQGLTYMQTYQKIRKFDHEAYYNMGRVYHMLGINNLAIEYYERALATTLPGFSCETHSSLNLIKETAYNLYILHKEHAPAVARKYLVKYLVI